ncbi:MAG: MoaF N-terminal domain-containing protein [Pseudomonadota bacterium]
MNIHPGNSDSLTKVLAGRAYKYTYSSGMAVELTLDENKANWAIVGGPNEGDAGLNDYLARQIEPDIYFIQWYEPDVKSTVTLVINERTKQVFASVVSPEDLEFDVAEVHEISTS